MNCVAIPIQSYCSSELVAAELGSRIRRYSAEAVAERGTFRIVLAGGTTPLAAYRRIATADLDWPDWEVYFGDERCLAPDHAERNSRAAAEALLDHVPIARKRIHPIRAELGAEAAATDYQGRIADVLPFDLVLLGMGEDGHTASLFPGHAVPEKFLVTAVHGAPKPPPDRVSLTTAALSRTAHLLIVVTGAAKRDAMRAWEQGRDLPIARVARGTPNVEVLCDHDALGRTDHGTPLLWKN